MTCSAKEPCDHNKFPGARMHCSVTSCQNSIYRCSEHRQGLR